MVASCSDRSRIGNATVAVFDLLVRVVNSSLSYRVVLERYFVVKTLRDKYFKVQSSTGVALCKSK